MKIKVVQALRPAQHWNRGGEKEEGEEEEAEKEEEEEEEEEPRFVLFAPQSRSTDFLLE